MQFPFARQFQQFIVRRTAPQEERQSRSEREIAELVRGAGRKIAGIGLKAEQKLGARQDELKRRFNSSVETPVAVAAPLIKAKGCFQIGILDWPSISPAKQRGDDLARARQLFFLVLRSANEDFCARWRLPNARRIKRPLNGEPVDGWIAHNVQSIDGRPEKRLNQIIFLGVASQN